MASRLIDYSCGNVTLQGYFSCPDTGGAPRPAVLVCHAWGGRDAFSEARADELAAMGYAALALDVYGKGVQGSSVEENQALMAPFLEDRARLRAHLLAALDTVRAQPEVDSSRVAAVGYCFGGLCVLDMARSGADLRGVVSFHGLLHPPEGLATEGIHSRVLVLHGHDDPMVPPEQVLAFEQEMTAANVDWQLHAYGGTCHSFTNPDANSPEMGAAYNPAAARRSWRSMQDFLAEVLAEVPAN